MANVVEVAVVGAGPYGLSVAAHLRASGLTFRAFGSSMQTWRNHMPKGMVLKSDGFATNLSDPDGELTLEHFCRQEGILYDHTRIPIALETFTRYGDAFQKRLVPDLEDRQVTALVRAADGFRLELDDGGTAHARRVVVAAGVSHFAYVPPQLRRLPSELLTHSSAHGDLERFRGQSVAVIGGGSSAVDVAALLFDAGADVRLIARRSSLAFNAAPDAAPPSLWERIRHPRSGIGPGLKSSFYAGAPWLFHYLPEDVRLRVVRRHLGPSAGYTVRERVLANVPLLLGQQVQRAEELDDRVQLTLAGADGAQRTLVADHVIAATGYRVDLRRLAFLDDELRAAVHAVDDAPVLSRHFQSSLPGLYFVGLMAAPSFGPVLRFVYGADFTARTVARHLVQSAARQAVAVAGARVRPA